jgi:hypothetical protein
MSGVSIVVSLSSSLLPILSGAKWYLLSLSIQARAMAMDSAVDKCSSVGGVRMSKRRGRKAMGCGDDDDDDDDDDDAVVAVLLLPAVVSGCQQLAKSSGSNCTRTKWRG